MFGRSKTAVALALLAAACAGEAVQGTTTAGALPDLASTTTVSTTSTLPASTSTAPRSIGPVDICGSGVGFDQIGERYTVDCFVVPVSFAPSVDGWRSLSAGEEWAELFWEGEDPGLTANVLLLAYRLDDTPQAMIDSIVEREGVNAMSDVEAGELGVREALVVDLETDRDRDFDDRCSTGKFQGLRYSRPGGFFNPGYLLKDVRGTGANQGFGLGACKRFRLWGVDVDGVTITVVSTAGGTADDRFDELVPIVESLLDSVTFGAA